MLSPVGESLACHYESQGGLKTAQAICCPYVMTPLMPSLSQMSCSTADVKAKASSKGREGGEATREATTAPAEQVAHEQPQDPGKFFASTP